MTEEGFLDLLGKMAVNTPNSAATAPAPTPAPVAHHHAPPNVHIPTTGVPAYASHPSVTIVPDDTSSSKLNSL